MDLDARIDASPVIAVLVAIPLAVIAWGFLVVILA